MRMARRDFLGGAAVLLLSGCGGSPGSSLAAVGGGSTPAPTPTPTPTASVGSPSSKTFTPEAYGAVGDGRTNDTAAFAAMSAAVNAAGGGTIVLKATTYVVGAHVADSTGAYAYGPAIIMTFDGCTKPLTITGNGACLRCADGLRFGTFDPLTGAATQHAMPYTGTGELASPYQGMIIAKNCTAKVSISDVELDGNIQKLLIGGQYGDTGWQIPAYGLQLVNNSGGEDIVGVHAHHQPVDGVLIDAPATRTTQTQLEQVNSEYNVRQGCSVVGGSNFSFSNCKFNHTGKAGMVSAPGAGVDIESENSPVRNLTFSGCEFSDNSGPGLVADSGDSQGASFDTCRFIGTTCWAAWPRKPNFQFSDCTFVGAICNTYGDSDASKAAQFTGCTFEDDAALSPTGQVYCDGSPIADLSSNVNVLFDECTFKLIGNLVLPWSTGAIYKNVTMSQTSQKQAYPRGTYLGTNRIDANVDLADSKINGNVTLNGVLLARTA